VTWREWSSTATPEEKARLRAIAEDGDAAVDADPVTSMAQAGALLVVSKWEGTNAGYAFHLTPSMCDIVVDDDQSAS
jgi:hypothetical protein